jgi:hypothetical protein
MTPPSQRFLPGGELEEPSAASCGCSMRSMNFFITLACLHGWTEASWVPLWGNASIVIVLNACSLGTSWNISLAVSGFLFSS